MGVNFDQALEPVREAVKALRQALEDGFGPARNHLQAASRAVEPIGAGSPVLVRSEDAIDNAIRTLDRLEEDLAQTTADLVAMIRDIEEAVKRVHAV